MVSVRVLVRRWLLLVVAGKDKAATLLLATGLKAQIVTITPPSITVTLVLADKHATPFIRPLFIVTISLPACPACLSVLCGPLVHVSAQLFVFLLSQGVGSAYTTWPIYNIACCCSFCSGKTASLILL